MNLMETAKGIPIPIPVSAKALERDGCFAASLGPLSAGNDRAG